MALVLNPNFDPNNPQSQRYVFESADAARALNPSFQGSLVTAQGTVPPQTGTRNLQLASGDTQSNLNLSNQLSGNLNNTITSTSSDAYSKFNDALLSMLKQYQTMGTANFASQAYNAQTQQNNAVLNPNLTNLQGASPAQQQSVIQSGANVFSPTIQGAQQGAQTFSEQLNSFGNLLNRAQDLATQHANDLKQAKTDAQNLIHDAISGGSDALAALIKSQPDIVKTAGYTNDTLNGVVTGLQKQEALAAQKALPTSADQNKLEQQYRTILKTAMSNRSGGIGLQDQKVNQSIHLRALVDQYYDPNTGQYNVPTSQYYELVIGLANLLSPTGAVAEQDRRELAAKTAASDIRGALQYVTGAPQNGNTQAIIKNLIDSIDRQGTISEQLRQGELAYLQGLRPTELDPSRAASLESQGMNSFNDFVKNGPAGSSNNINNYGSSDPMADLQYTINQHKDQNRESLIKDLQTTFPEFNIDQIAQQVYNLIPSKK